MITIGTHGNSPVRIRSFEKFSATFFSDTHTWTLDDLNNHILNLKRLKEKFDDYNDMCTELMDYYHVLGIYVIGDIDSILNAYNEYKELRQLDCDDERND